MNWNGVKCPLNSNWVILRQFYGTFILFISILRMRSAGVFAVGGTRGPGVNPHGWEGAPVSLPHTPRPGTKPTPNGPQGYPNPLYRWDGYTYNNSFTTATPNNSEPCQNQHNPWYIQV